MLASTQQPKPQIPLSGLYHMRNYSSSSNWLAYQVSVNEVRLIKYTKDLTISQGFVFQFVPEPIKQIKVITDDQSGKVYVAVLYLTRYVIYQNNAEICSFRLKLDRNIVVFDNSFVACDGVNDGKQVYFTFLTAKGEVYVVAVDNVQKAKVVNVSAGEGRFCAVKAVDGNIVVGDQSGKLMLVDLNSSTVLKSFDTGSKMPILHVGWINKRVIAATCQGEIFNLSQDLTKFTSLSAHQGMITHLQIANNRIFSWGDDCVLNVFQIDSNSGDLQLKKTSKYQKKANMIVTLQNSTLINFYEETALQEIGVN